MQGERIKKIRERTLKTGIKVVLLGKLDKKKKIILFYLKSFLYQTMNTYIINIASFLSVYWPLAGK